MKPKNQHETMAESAQQKIKSQDGSQTMTLAKRKPAAVAILYARLKKEKGRLRKSFKKAQPRSDDNNRTSFAPTLASTSLDTESNSYDAPSSSPTIFRTPEKSETTAPVEINVTTYESDEHIVWVDETRVSPDSVMEMRNMSLFVGSTDSEDSLFSSENDAARNIAQTLDYKEAEHDGIGETMPALPSSTLVIYSVHHIHNNDSNKDDDKKKIDSIKDFISTALASATMQTSNTGTAAAEDVGDDNLTKDFSCECMTYDPARSEWTAKFSREEGDEEDLDWYLHLQLDDKSTMGNNDTNDQKEKESFVLNIHIQHKENSLSKTQNILIQRIYKSVERTIKSTLLVNQFHVESVDMLQES